MLLINFEDIPLKHFYGHALRKLSENEFIVIR